MNASSAEISYSTRSNATRAAKRQGIVAEPVEREGRWYNEILEVEKPVIEPELETEILTYDSGSKSMHVILDLDELVFLDSHEDAFLLGDLTHVFYSSRSVSIEAVEMGAFLKDRSALELEKIYKNVFGREPKYFGTQLIEIIRDGLRTKGAWSGPTKELLRQASKNEPTMGISENLSKFCAKPFNLIEAQKFMDELAIAEHERSVIDSHIKAKLIQENKIVKTIEGGGGNGYYSNSSNNNEETQMSTDPKVKSKETAEEKAAKAKAKAAEKAAEKAAKDAAKAKAKEEKAAAKAPKQKTPRIEQNGTTRPGPDTTGGRIWAVIEAETLKQGALPQISALIAHADLKDDLEVNVRAIYARYKKFNGLTKPRAAETPQVEQTAA